MVVLLFFNAEVALLYVFLCFFLVRMHSAATLPSRAVKPTIAKFVKLLLTLLVDARAPAVGMMAAVQLLTKSCKKQASQGGSSGSTADTKISL